MESVDALGLESGFPECREDAVDVLGAVGLDRDAERHRVGVVAGCLELVVIKLNDVGALLGKQGGHLDELARSIRQLDLEAAPPAPQPRPSTFQPSR